MPMDIDLAEVLTRYSTALDAAELDRLEADPAVLACLADVPMLVAALREKGGK